MSFWVSPVSASELQAGVGHLGEGGGGGEEQGELATQAAAPGADGLCYHHAQRRLELEEQNTGWRTLMENLTGEGEFKQLGLGEKDLPILVHQLIAENEEQGKDMRGLERRITELDVCKEGLK